ncbi:MAG: ATP-binding cassette domain-containing protein, partial [Ruminococcus sp.]|nr:ATP-binding cassette domain-containing protein [Ruminococcus sp.]
YFGIGPWYDKSVSVLSGGQKQLLNLAAVLVMQPELLILDEPTAQLDPIAAADFIATLKRLNQDFGLTIIIAEHRLEELVPICDRLLVMDNGRLIANDSPKKVIRQLKNRSDFLICMPSAARIYAELSDDDDCPLTVRDGGYFIRANYLNDISNIDTAEKNTSTENALEFKDVYFRYEKNGRDILNGLDMTVKMGEVYCILGGNGSGKTTTLNVSSGLVKAYSGNVRIFGKKIKDYKNRSLYNKCLAMLPQDVQTVFLRNTVREEFEDSGTDINKLPFEAAHLFDKHPYDLSGGEQQLVALAKILAAEPKLLLLDEPTKGLDAAAKKKIIEVIRSLSEGGMTIVIVTHDVEFAALCSDRCAMFFNGKIVSSGSPEKFFSENNFYTTAASRMTRGYYENAVTVESVIELCRKNGKRGADYDSN